MAKARDDGTVTPRAVGDATTCPENCRAGYMARPLPDPQLAAAWGAAPTVQCQIQEYRETDRVFYDPGTHDVVRARVDGSIVNSIDVASARGLVGSYCGTDVLHPNEEYLFGSSKIQVGRNGFTFFKSSFPVSKYAITLKCSNLYPRALRLAA